MLMLKINMRLHADVVGYNVEYAKWLEKLSYDSACQGRVSLPEYVSTTSQLDELYEKVFPRSELHNWHNSPDF